MQCQWLAGTLAEARQDIEYARRNAGFHGQFGDTDGGQRRLFRRLENDRIAHGQGRSEFPARHQQREVPRHNSTDDAERLAGNQTQLILRCRGDFAVHLVDRLSGPSQTTNAGSNVDSQRVGDRLAHINGLQQRQLFGMFFQKKCELLQGFLAVYRGGFRPRAGFESATGSADRTVDVLGFAFGNLCAALAVHRADAAKGFTGSGIDIGAVDECLGSDGEGCSFGFPLSAGEFFRHGTFSFLVN